MDEFLNSYSRDTLIGIGGLLTGIVGIFIGLISYFKSQRYKLPLYNVSTFNFSTEKIGKNQDLIRIYYKDIKVINFAATKIVIWNGGNEPIDKHDIPENAKFSIYPSEGVEIYDYELINNTDKDNRISLTRVNENIIIDFDFLDPRQGCLISIIHSGKNPNSILVSGRLKGGIVLNSASKPTSFEYSLMRLLGFLFYPFLFFNNLELRNKQHYFKLISSSLFYIIVLFPSDYNFHFTLGGIIHLNLYGLLLIVLIIVIGLYLSFKENSRLKFSEFLFKD